MNGPINLSGECPTGQFAPGSKTRCDPCVSAALSYVVTSCTVHSSIMRLSGCSRSNAVGDPCSCRLSQSYSSRWVVMKNKMATSS